MTLRILAITRVRAIAALRAQRDNSSAVTS